ncbi:MAG: hypothetical protein M3Y60_09970 [Bacteroidota bacterium]|nr:hypothetical protein [Bacteroidota bacterium]
MNFVYRTLCIVFLALVAAPAVAQDDLNELLTESMEDGEKLIKAYVSPFMKSVSLGLNQGWYNTAAPHKIAGVDLTITVNAMTIPKSDLFYDVSKLNLEVLELDGDSPDHPFAPTILGPDRAPIFSYTDEETGLTQTQTGPGGVDLEKELGKNWVPLPMAHLGFGLPKGTDVKLRFTPTIDAGDDTTLKLFGIGVMHDVKQWIPGIKLLPFDLSGFVGYTKFKMEAYFDPESNPDQRGLFEMNATTIQGLISKKFSVLTLYGGVGYNIANSTLAMKGTYDINEDGQVSPSEVDPIDLKFSASGFRTTAGMRLKLAVFTLHADYTIQKYKCLTVGFGISVR